MGLALHWGHAWPGTGAGNQGTWGGTGDEDGDGADPALGPRTEDWRLGVVSERLSLRPLPLSSSCTVHVRFGAVLKVYLSRPQPGAL